MTIFSFHLAETSVSGTASALLRGPTSSDVSGLRHAECMYVMALGSPILSAARMQVKHLAVFASWDDEQALDAFVAGTELGKTLAAGWQVRLEFLRRWGRVSEFDDLPAVATEMNPQAPVVAVTLARLRLTEVPRFVRWGKPVERLVRDHPGTTLALAAMRPPRTICTFSVWRSQQDMTDMVQGKGAAVGIERHTEAMLERERKDFHREFTTLRFRPVREIGEWQGRSDIIPSASGRRE